MAGIGDSAGIGPGLVRVMVGNNACVLFGKNFKGL